MALPEVLRNPPWRKQRIASIEPLRAPMPARLRATAEERSLAQAGLREPLSGPALERCVELLLERADLRKPLPRSEVAKLSDDALRDLVKDVAPSCWDAELLRLLVDRLGDAVLDEAIRIARSVHPRRTFWALASVESEALATLAARDFAHEREAAFEGSEVGDAERWLIRFPECSLDGLRGETSAEACSTRRFLSAYCGVAASSEEAPFACLSAGAGDAIQRRRWALDIARERTSAVFSELRTMDVSAQLAPFVAFHFARERDDVAGAWLKHRAADVLAILMNSAHPSARLACGFLLGEGVQTETEEVPTHLPPLPRFLGQASLAAPRLRDGETLSAEAMEVLLELLRFSNLKRPHVGMRDVKQACIPESLDALADSILSAWINAGAPIRERWCLEVPGKIGGPISVQTLADNIRSWGASAQARTTEWDEDAHRAVVTAEGDHAWAFAREGLQVLVAQGSPAALNAVDEFARSARAGWLRYEARKLRPEQATRPMQTNNTAEPLPALRAEIGETYCVGPRSFRLRVSETLEVSLIDEQGHASAGFPRQRATDDAELYAQQKARFIALQAEAKTLAKQQLGALEQAMCAQTVWTTEAFQTHFVAHPLLRFVGRRLVFSYIDEEVGLRAFRVAEDASYADVEDVLLTLPRDARVRILHPVTITAEARQQWTKRFQEYEIVQPFAQLERAVFSADGVEGYELRAMRNAGVSRGDLFALPKRGWKARRDGQTTARWERPLAISQAIVTLQASPGLTMDAAPAAGQRVVSLRCSTALDRLPEIDFSELLLEAARLRKESAS